MGCYHIRFEMKLELAFNNNQFVGYLYIRHDYGRADKNGCHQAFMIGVPLQEDRGACLFFTLKTVC